MANPLDRDLARKLREMRRSMAKEAHGPKLGAEPAPIEDLAPTATADRLGPSVEPKRPSWDNPEAW